MSIKMRKLDEGLFIVDGGPTWRGVWSKTKARKAATCVLSGVAIQSGDAIIRPITNGEYRRHRILLSKANDLVSCQT